MLVDICLTFYAVPHLSDLKVNVMGHRFSGKAQAKRATLSCDSSYYPLEKSYIIIEPRHEKTGFCIYKNKGADQLRSNCEADQRLCFRYTNSTISLLLKSEISSV